MEGNSWRPAQGQPSTAGAAAGDWRCQLPHDARQRVVNKIMDELKRRSHISEPEGLIELQNIAVQLEEKIYTVAASQSDYLRKVSLKVLSMATKTQHSPPINPSMPNTAVPNQNPIDPDWLLPLMERNSWRPAQGEPFGDWRSQLLYDARPRIVSKIMDTLKRNLPISVLEVLNELEKIAVQLEEKAYTTATSQSDYLRTISLKMLAMETKAQHAPPIKPSMPNTTIPDLNAPDPGLAQWENDPGDA